jgi:hypothetical protein
MESDGNDTLGPTPEAEATPEAPSESSPVVKLRDLAE